MPEDTRSISPETLLSWLNNKEPSQACAWCGTSIAETPTWRIHAAGRSRLFTPYHAVCAERLAIGGLNHQRRLCRCHGGVLAADPEDMTLRQAAEAAVAFHASESGSDTVTEAVVARGFRQP